MHLIRGGGADEQIRPSGGAARLSEDNFITAARPESTTQNGENYRRVAARYCGSFRAEAEVVVSQQQLHQRGFKVST